MRESLLDILRCPSCQAARSFDLEVRVRDAHEVREGQLTCRSCQADFAIEDGIVELMPAPADHVSREAQGLERFAEIMRADGWDRERVRSLPYADHGYWYVQAVSFEQLLASVDLRPGQRILDVGSNTCWASNRLAQRGLDVIALDIATVELQGLRTAEYFIDDGEVFFERMLSDMSSPAIADETLDYVFCCEVLHHNDPAALRRTLSEMYRMLRPGGQLLMINEPMRFPLKLKRDHGSEVAEFQGNEHVYFFHQYYLAVRRAGFRVSLRQPLYLPFFSGAPTQLLLDASSRQLAHELVRFAARRFRPTRRAFLAWKLLVAGDFALNVVATKPPRPGNR